MIKIDKTHVMNLEGAIRGARNAMNSWDRIDSRYDENGNYILGENDLGLSQKLCKAGSDHRKFVRQIMVSVDILAPMYWWKEYDTYKISTTANSTSTMHKIHSKKFSVDDFSHDKLGTEATLVLENLIAYLEQLRLQYKETKDKQIWYEIIQLLPSSYNQLRTLTLNYENLINMHHSRKNHKLQEWHVFCAWAETLPYAKELIVI